MCRELQVSAWRSQIDSRKTNDWTSKLWVPLFILLNLKCIKHFIKCLQSFSKVGIFSVRLNSVSGTISTGNEEENGLWCLTCQNHMRERERDVCITYTKECYNNLHCSTVLYVSRNVAFSNYVNTNTQLQLPPAVSKCLFTFSDVLSIDVWLEQNDQWVTRSGLLLLQFLF